MSDVAYPLAAVESGFLYDDSELDPLMFPPLVLVHIPQHAEVGVTVLGDDLVYHLWSPGHRRWHGEHVWSEIEIQLGMPSVPRDTAETGSRHGDLKRSEDIARPPVLDIVGCGSSLRL